MVPGSRTGRAAGHIAGSSGSAASAAAGGVELARTPAAGTPAAGTPAAGTPAAGTAGPADRLSGRVSAASVASPAATRASRSVRNLLVRSSPLLLSSPPSGELLVALVDVAEQPRSVRDEPGEAGRHDLAIGVAADESVGQQAGDGFVDVTGGKHKRVPGGQRDGLGHL